MTEITTHFKRVEGRLDNVMKMGTLDRLTEAMENLAHLTSQLSFDYVGVKKRLDEASRVAKGQKGPGTKD
jgi:hypothetical protein